MKRELWINTFTSIYNISIKTLRGWRERGREGESNTIEARAWSPADRK